MAIAPARCAPTVTAFGVATKTQVAGDCRKVICDGTGGTAKLEDDTDVPVDGKECTLDQCVDGIPSNPPVASGTVCTQGGILCDGNGACVACLADGNCTDPLKPYCLSHLCVPASCKDGVMDSGETGVDCGGPDCPPCAG